MLPTRIRELRRARGLTQLELATMLGFTVKSTVSQWERGKAYPHSTMLPALAAALGCTPNDLFAAEGTGEAA